MLIGRIGKAFDPSPQRLVEDQGEYRGVSRGTAGNGFLTIPIAGSC